MAKFIIMGLLLNLGPICLYPLKTKLNVGTKMSMSIQRTDAIPEGILHDKNIPRFPIYNAPCLSIDDVVAGCTIENLGLSVFVGPSICMAEAGIDGLGLYLALADDVDQTDLASGTVICGYSKGNFHGTASGDKCVAFAFCSTKVLVFLNKKLMSLAEAIDLLEQAGNPDFDLTYAVYGHLVSRDGSDYTIAPDPGFNEDRYFIPTSDQSPAIINMGMMANDLAYSIDIQNEDEYKRVAAEKNVLSLAWRLEVVGDKMLHPSWPVGECRAPLQML